MDLSGDSERPTEAGNEISKKGGSALIDESENG